MIGIDELKFDERGLIPAIVIDSESRELLTLAYMNRESLRHNARTRADLLLEPFASGALAQGRDER